jgi:hypothetical protein
MGFETCYFSVVSYTSGYMLSPLMKGGDVLATAWWGWDGSFENILLVEPDDFLDTAAPTLRYQRYQGRVGIFIYYLLYLYLYRSAWLKTHRDIFLSTPCQKVTLPALENAVCTEQLDSKTMPLSRLIQQLYSSALLRHMVIFDDVVQIHPVNRAPCLGTTLWAVREHSQAFTLLHLLPSKCGL